MILPCTPPLAMLCLTQLSLELFGLLTRLSIVYLMLVKIAKRWFYRRLVLRNREHG